MVTHLVMPHLHHQPILPLTARHLRITPPPIPLVKHSSSDHAIPPKTGDVTRTTASLAAESPIRKENGAGPHSTMVKASYVALSHIPLFHLPFLVVKSMFNLRHVFGY
jgi:hypothetical protein